MDKQVLPDDFIIEIKSIDKKYESAIVVSNPPPMDPAYWSSVIERINNIKYGLASTDNRIIPAWCIEHVGAEEIKDIKVTIHTLNEAKGLLSEITTDNAYNKHPQIIEDLKKNLK